MGTWSGHTKANNLAGWTLAVFYCHPRRIFIQNIPVHFASTISLHFHQCTCQLKLINTLWTMHERFICVTCAQHFRHSTFGKHTRELCTLLARPHTHINLKREHCATDANTDGDCKIAHHYHIWFGASENVLHAIKTSWQFIKTRKSLVLVSACEKLWYCVDCV